MTGTRKGNSLAAKTQIELAGDKKNLRKASRRQSPLMRSRSAISAWSVFCERSSTLH